ncbi:MAG: hypothetical protein CME19_14325 [Gemmatimonadetes bacterium]|nr:hypothetical protein [Gemmatimonadota bacterium]
MIARMIGRVAGPSERKRIDVPRFSDDEFALSEIEVASVGGRARREPVFPEGRSRGDPHAFQIVPSGIVRLSIL